jgi:hypothetical protein
MTLPWKNKKTEGEQREELVKTFRRVFTTPDGRACLVVLLEDLKFREQVNNQNDEALRNYATFLLQERIGIDLRKDGIDALLNSADKGEVISRGVNR